VALVDEILRELDVVKKRPRVHNYGPNNTVYDLWGVCLLILHAKQVTQHLEGL
jgi:hypothetical protein